MHIRFNSPIFPNPGDTGMLSSQGSITPAAFFPDKSYESADSVPALVEEIGGVLPDSGDQHSHSPPPSQALQRAAGCSHPAAAQPAGRQLLPCPKTS